jgi:predicted N-acetyltransferase YhbS
LIDITAAQAADLPEVDLLLDARFGPARRRRTAYRLRDGMAALPALSFVARDCGTLVGSVQCWPIALSTTTGAMLPLTLLGPLVIAADHDGQGIGSALMARVLEAVDAADTPPLLLIGDEPYYGRFGFSAARTGGFVLPGPVDRARLLLRGGEDLPALGWLGPRHGVRRAA